MSLLAVPVAGSPTLIAAPVPNPVNFNFTAGQVASSSQVDSDFYQLWNFVGAIVTGLNGLTYCPAPAISSVAIGTGLAGSVGAAVPGTGTTLTLALAHGDYQDIVNAQTVGGTKTYSSSALFSAGALFGGGGSALAIAEGFSSTFPTIGNSGDGGFNLQVASTSALPMRLFKYDGTTLTQLMGVTPAGALSIGSPINGSMVKVPPLLDQNGNDLGGAPRQLLIRLTAVGSSLTISWTGAFSSNGSYIAHIVDSVTGAVMTQQSSYQTTSLICTGTTAGHLYVIHIVGF